MPSTVSREQEEVDDNGGTIEEGDERADDDDESTFGRFDRASRGETRCKNWQSTPLEQTGNAASSICGCIHSKIICRKREDTRQLSFIRTNPAEDSVPPCRALRPLDQSPKGDIQRLCYAEQGVQRWVPKSPFDEGDHGERKSGFCRQRVHGHLQRFAAFA